MSRAYLDYYATHGIIPVRQDISNLQLHFRRREGLYRTLGIVPGMVEGKLVAELGPGTGDNASYIASLNPKDYTLVDANPASIQALNDKKNSGLFGDNVTIVDCDIRNFDKKNYYDLVICEGTVPGQANSEKFLTHVASLAKLGGVVVFTTISATSVLADICRRMIKPVVAKNYKSFEELHDYLTQFFAEDLSLLPGMSRRHEDWVLDQILHPWNDELFPFPRAISSIRNSFDFHSSSPRFFQDWRWYKSVSSEDFGVNDLVLDCYNNYSSALIDYRVDPLSANSCDGGILEEMCLKAYWSHVDAWHSDNEDKVGEFTRIVAEIADYIASSYPITSQSLRSYVVGMDQLKICGDASRFNDFRSLFGRGQQYVSCIRRG